MCITETPVHQQHWEDWGVVQRPYWRNFGVNFNVFLIFWFCLGLWWLLFYQFICARWNWEV